MTDDDFDAMRAIADDIRREAESPMHGHFPGGDPREFSPDPESTTDAEMERYTADCAAWERGEPIDRGGPHHPLVKDGEHVGHVTIAHYGLGVYTYRDEPTLKLAQDLDDWIDRARQVFT